MASRSKVCNVFMLPNVAECAATLLEFQPGANAVIREFLEEAGGDSFLARAFNATEECT